MLTTKLVLERLNKEGRLLERREQESRCFLKQFIELLYLAHYQTTSGTPYSMTDIRGATVDVDSDVYTPAIVTGASKSTLTLGSPPGSCQTLHPNGLGGPTGVIAAVLQSILMGEHLGIQIGGGISEVTPTDRFLETRFGHGIKIADGVNATFESYKTGNDADAKLYTDTWRGQSFRAQHHHKLYSVKLLLYREGSPGTVTVSIYAGRWFRSECAAFGSALVTQTFDGNSLTENEAGEWKEVTFPSQIEIAPGMDYVIVVYTGGAFADSVHWLYDTSSAAYPRGIYLASGNGGDTWSETAGDDFMFEEIGRSSGELQYGGCELVDMVISDPDGEFTIRRYFNNKSGESRTVNEVGIYAAGGSDGDECTYSFCIAHDIVSPGVAVADGQLLRATYVPQITV